MFRSGFKRKRSTKKTSRQGGSKRRASGRASKMYSFKNDSAATPYHPWRNYRPKVQSTLSGYSSDGQLVKMTTSAVLVTTDSAVFTSFNIQANSISDPFGASGATRPAGYTQWANLYNFSAVQAASLTVEWMQGASVSGSPLIFGIFPQAAANGLVTDYNDALSQARCKYRIQDNATSATPLSVLGHRQRPLGLYFSTNQIMGQDKAYSMSSQNNSGVSANPTLLWYYTLWQDTVDSSTTYDSSILITLTQYVRFWARIALADA